MRIAVLHLQLLEPPILVGRQPGLGTGIDLGQVDPPTQRVAVDAQLLSGPSARPVTDSCKPGWTSRSSTRRINRSRSSTGYFFGAGMAPPFPGISASTKPGRFMCPPQAASVTASRMSQSLGLRERQAG
jgi:hypothetical protein